MRKLSESELAVLRIISYGNGAKLQSSAYAPLQDLGLVNQELKITESGEIVLSMANQLLKVFFEMPLVADLDNIDFNCSIDGVDAACFTFRIDFLRNGEVKSGEIYAHYIYGDGDIVFSFDMAESQIHKSAMQHMRGTVFNIMAAYQSQYKNKKV